MSQNKTNAVQSANTKHKHDSVQLSKQLQAEKNRVNQLKVALKNKAKQQSRGTTKSKIKAHALLETSLCSTLARAVALPLTYTARVPDPWDEREVAVANPFMIFEDSFVNLKGNEALLGDGVAVYAVSRDPLRFLMVPRKNQSVTWEYLLNWVETVDTLQVIAPATRLPLHRMSFDQNLEFTKSTYIQGSKGYGDVQFPACDEEYNWLWIDGRDVSGLYTTEVIFEIYDTPSYPGGVVRPTGVASAYAEVWPYGADEPFRAELTKGGLGRAVIKIQNSAYYRFSYSSTVTMGLGEYLQIKVAGSCDTFEYLPIPGFVERQTELSEVRTVGVSLMVSPVSTTLAEGGIVCGLQIPEGELITSYFDIAADKKPGTAGLSGLLNARHSKALNFKEGMYAWHKPTCEGDLSFMKPFVYNTIPKNNSIGFDASGPNQTVSYRGHLFPPGGWLAIGVAGAPNPTTGLDYPGCIVKITAAVSLNFDTESLWYHVEESTSDVTLLEVRKMLDGVPQYTENPFHVKDITNWISKNASTLKNLAKAGLTGLTGAFVPEAAPVVAALGNMF